MTAETSTVNPLADLDAYAGVPRVEGLWLDPDGGRLVVSVATLNAKKTKFSTALWEVDPTGARPARRLTRSDQGESTVAFTPEGDLLFVSRRPDQGAPGEDEPQPQLWLQPRSGGDARVLAELPGGFSGLHSAAGTLLFGSGVLPSATDLEEDAELRRSRKDEAVTAILHEQYPVRYWDHDLGPDAPRLFAADLPDPAGEDRLDPRDLTGHVGLHLQDFGSWDLAPDGRTAVVSWMRPEDGGAHRATLVAIDLTTGERRTLADDPEHEYTEPRISPDSRTVVFVTERRTTPADPGDQWLATTSLDTPGAVRPLTADWDRWPHGCRWTPDGSTIVCAANDEGRGPVFLVDAATGEPTRLTADHGSYSALRVSPDGQWVYALRSAYDHPPAPVRVPLVRDGGRQPEPLPGPAEALGAVLTMPGTLTEISTTADDGQPLRAWLALPPDAADSPAPMLLWAHGGPLSSWNAWTWRWNPWLLVSRGYAVLLPDPALSTGYGVEFIRRGWGSWGERPYTDLMAVTDAAVARPDIDGSRIAAMGGSFGGYMANWIAGHTDRFSAIVTHASLWALDQFGPTTDAAFYWSREMDQRMAETSSPHRSADAISTPMLVIHGDKDYRVPIGEALRLWWDLMSRSTADGGPHKFLYFPDENHWVLTPNHAKLWYRTVAAFLDHHVQGKPWQRPTALG